MSWCGFGLVERLIGLALPTVLASMVAKASTLDATTDLREFFAPVEQKWVIQGLIDVPAYSFYLGSPAIRGVAYQPNFAPRLGAKLNWRGWGTMVAFPVGLPAREVDRRGASSQTNLVLNRYWRQMAFDLYYQRFRGFYVASPWDELSFRRPARYPQLPDARVTNTGFNLYYARNGQTYSLQAAFSQSEFQLQSGGSWIYSTFYNHLDMNLGSAFRPGSDADMIQQLPNLGSGRFDTLGVGLGYGYTWIRRRFFANTQLIVTPAAQLQHIDRADGKSSQRLALAAKGNLNASAGWNYSEYFWGAKFLLDTQYAVVTGTEVWSSLIVAQAFLGRRF